MNRYPLPRMVCMCTGFCGLSSSFWRSQATCTSWVRDEPSLLYSQTPRNSSSLRNHLTSMVGQMPQKLQFLASEIHGRTSLPHFRAIEIHFDFGKTKAGNWDWPAVPHASAAVGMRHCLQPGELLAAAAAQDRPLVADQLAAAVREDRWTVGETRSVLLAAIGQELSDAAALWNHGAADCGNT